MTKSVFQNPLEYRNSLISSSKSPLYLIICCNSDTCEMNSCLYRWNKKSLISLRNWNKLPSALRSTVCISSFLSSEMVLMYTGSKWLFVRHTKYWYFSMASSGDIVGGWYPEGYLSSLGTVGINEGGSNRSTYFHSSVDVENSLVSTLGAKSENLASPNLLTYSSKWSLSSPKV